MDPTACFCLLPHCPQCGREDFWRLNGKTLIRVHQKPRRALFDPLAISVRDLPIAADKLRPLRVTTILKESAQTTPTQHDEDWRAPEAKGSLPYLWTGESVFEVLEEHINWELYNKSVQPVEAERNRFIQLQEEGADWNHFSEIAQPAEAERNRLVQLQEEADRNRFSRFPDAPPSACYCFLPSCATCNGGQNSRAQSSNMATKATSGRGHIVSESVLHVVAGVHDELEKMLATESPSENWLCEGRGWAAIPTWKDSKGSRLEKVVARLCRCGIWTVQKARACSRAGTFFAPQVRGRKRRTIAEDEEPGHEDGDEKSEQNGAAALWEGGWARHPCSPPRRYIV